MIFRAYRGAIGVLSRIKISISTFKKGMLTSILESLEVYCCLFSAMLIGSFAALTSRAPVIAYFENYVYGEINSVPLLNLSSMISIDQADWTVAKAEVNNGGHVRFWRAVKPCGSYSIFQNDILNLLIYLCCVCGVK